MEQMLSVVMETGMMLALIAFAVARTWARVGRTEVAAAPRMIHSARRGPPQPVDEHWRS